jgi:hypothetical protein
LRLDCTHSYNILPDNLSQCQRRIALELVTGVSMSAISDEFVVHVPDEYDYRWKSNKKELIVETLSLLYRKTCGKKLNVMQVAEPELKDITVTKDQAKEESREDKMRRKAEMVSQAHESDDEVRILGVPVPAFYCVNPIVFL